MDQSSIITFADNVRCARALLESGDLLGAKVHFEHAVSLSETGHISLPEYIDCLLGLTDVYCRTGELDKAELAVFLALATIKKQLGPDHFLYGKHLNDLAFVRLQQGRFKEAEKVLLEAIVLIEKCFDSRHPELLTPLESLGHVYKEQKQVNKAVQSWERAISIREESLGATDPGIKLFKAACRDLLAASRKASKEARPAAKDDTVQLSLFS